MNKEKTSNNLTEAEQRELKLEAVTHSLFNLIEEYIDISPFPSGNLLEIATHIYNEAEIRPDIDEWFSLNIVMEE